MGGDPGLVRIRVLNTGDGGDTTTNYCIWFITALMDLSKVKVSLGESTKLLPWEKVILFSQQVNL